jgi:hypothetical protein
LSGSLRGREAAPHHATIVGAFGTRHGARDAAG